jgi:succinate dehydrogenase cytochrome b subunit
MPTLRAALWSSVGKKALAAVTGLGMSVFLVAHLLGNLTLITGDADRYNAYSHFLLSLGPLLSAVEIGLVLFLIVHVVEGVVVWLDKRKARPDGYVTTAAAGGPSRMTLASRTMLWTGGAILVFTIVHLRTFKYGPGMDQGYVTTVNGVRMRDLNRLVVERFGHLGYVSFYVSSMILLGFHLRHGFWSAFQSLGTHHPRWTRWFYTAGALTAMVLALGYLAIPVWIYLRGGVP